MSEYRPIYVCGICGVEPGPAHEHDSRHWVKNTERATDTNVEFPHYRWRLWYSWSLVKAGGRMVRDRLYALYLRIT